MVGSTNPDAAAIADVLAGQRESFGLIVDRYERPLFRVALSRLGDAELAEEAVQEAFLCAYRSLHTYDSRFSFRTWLWTILVNQCRRAYGKAKRTPPTLSMDAV
ncbi:MAG: sigma factor, partial [Planctomycetota bacterium]